MSLEVDIEELRSRYTRDYIAGLKRQFKGKEDILEEILKIGKGNSLEPLWIAGGAVYRTIIEEEYGVKTKRTLDEKGKEIIDFDFVVSQLSTEPYSPGPLGWSTWRTRFGNPAFRKNGYNVVIMDLSSFSTLAARNLTPTIENFLAITPLNIHSIAVLVGDDPYNVQLFGNKGILAIYQKEVKINDLEAAEDRILREWAHDALELGLNLEEFNRDYVNGKDFVHIIKQAVKKKAEELIVFTPNLISPPPATPPNVSTNPITTNEVRDAMEKGQTIFLDDNKVIHVPKKPEST